MPFAEPGIADVLVEMRRRVHESMLIPAEMLHPEPVLYPTAVEMAERWRAQGDFIRAAQLEGAVVDAIFKAFFPVPNWRRVKRERRKAYERMMESGLPTPDGISHLARRHRIRVTMTYGGPRPGAVLAQRRQEQFELRRDGLLVRAAADEITRG